MGAPRGRGLTTVTWPFTPGKGGHAPGTLFPHTAFHAPVFRLNGCRWWPFLGIFLFALPFLFGHFGFGCHRTDPGVTTDPGVATESQTDGQALSSPEPSAASPGPAAILVPLGGGALIVGSALKARRSS